MTGSEANQSRLLHKLNKKLSEEHRQLLKVRERERERDRQTEREKGRKERERGMRDIIHFLFCLT